MRLGDNEIRISGARRVDVTGMGAREPQLLESLNPSVATVEAVRTVLQNQLDVLRKREVSWAAIGDALGISRQAAWERFS